MPVADAGDRQALRALVDAYAAAADGRDVAAFLALFTSDAELSVQRGDGEPAVYAGAARLAHIPARLRRYRHTFHDVGYHSCEIDGNAAIGTAGCQAHHVTEDAAGATDLVLTIRYRDAYLRNADGWRFSRRAVHILWTSDHPVAVA